MFLDRAVRTTSPPSVATVCALLVLFLATGTAFGVDDGDESPAPSGFEEEISQVDSTDASALPESLATGPDAPADVADTLGVPIDTLVTPPDGLLTSEDDSAPGAESPGAAGDTLATAEASGPEAVRDPYAPGVSFLPS